MKHCSSCLLPETHETITFDKNNKCSICQNFSFKQKSVNWKKKKILNGDVIEIVQPFFGG